MKKVIWTVIVVAIVALVVWGASSKDAVNQASTGTGPVKMGVMLPLTGDAAAYGEGARNIYQIAVEEINAAGGISGRPIELIIEDSKCNGADAANAAQKLVNVDAVEIIIGGFCSGESLAAVPVAAAGKVALFSPGSSNPTLTGINEFFSRDYPSDATQGKTLADVAFTERGYKNVAFIQEQTDYAAGVYSAFANTFTALGGKVTKEEFPTATTDFRSTLTKIKNAKPDALFIDTQTPAVSDRILAQIAQLDWKPVILINDATGGDPAVVAKYKVLLEGALTAQYGIDSNNAKFKKLVASYREKFGVDMPYQSYGQTEYDAIYIAKDAIEAVGYDGQKIAAWLKSKVKGWEGASGKVTILSNGDREGGHVPQMVKDGKVVPFSK